MIVDRDVVDVSHATVYRVLAQGGRLAPWSKCPSKKGAGLVQPLRSHEHGHVDIAYLNLGSTFYDLCSLLDGCSGAIIHREIRKAMTETEGRPPARRAEGATDRPR